VTDNTQAWKEAHHVKCAVDGTADDACSVPAFAATDKPLVAEASSADCAASTSTSSSTQGFIITPVVPDTFTHGGTGYCSDWRYLPEGGYPARLDSNADPLQECAERCTTAADADPVYSTTAFYVRNNDQHCACSSGTCSSVQGYGYTAYNMHRSSQSSSAQGPTTGKVWGDSLYGGDASSVDLTNVVYISCGDQACVARKEDGTGLAWGDSTRGGDATSVDLTNLVDISCGGSACVALKEDGTGLVWGRSCCGGDPDSTDSDAFQASSPADLTNLVDISCGGQACVARKADGTGLAWGRHLHGETQLEVTSPIWLTSVVVTGPASLGRQMVQGWHGEISKWGHLEEETQVPLTSPIWSTSAVAGMFVWLGRKMAQGWHGATTCMGETQVPLTSPIWSTSAVVTRPASLGRQMAQG